MNTRAGVLSRTDQHHKINNYLYEGSVFAPRDQKRAENALNHAKCEFIERRGQVQCRRNKLQAIRAVLTLQWLFILYEPVVF